LKRRRHILLKK